MITIPSKEFRALDRQEPVYAEPERKQSFTNIDVEMFIVDLARSDDPVKLLEDNGLPTDHDMAMMLVEMCVNWQKSNLAVHAVAGAYFWRLMKFAALERYNAE